MVQRWILDQMRHWVDVLGVDGFRIDLAGQIDKQTLLRARRELPHDLIIYGEPWIAPSDPDVRANPAWSWYKADAPITFFQDDARNAFQGSPFDVDDRGWAGGNAGARSAAMAALANDYAEEPLHHERHLLPGHPRQLGARGPLRAAGTTTGWRAWTSRRYASRRGSCSPRPGPVVIHGGTEMLRSKGLAPLEEREVEVAGGPVRFKGRDDTYNLRAPNRFLWDALAPGSAQAAMRDYWRGLSRYAGPSVRGGVPRRQGARRALPLDHPRRPRASSATWSGGASSSWPTTAATTASSASTFPPGHGGRSATASTWISPA